MPFDLFKIFKNAFQLAICNTEWCARTFEIHLSVYLKFSRIFMKYFTWRILFTWKLLELKVNLQTIRAEYLCKSSVSILEEEMERYLKRSQDTTKSTSDKNCVTWQFSENISRKYSFSLFVFLLPSSLSLCSFLLFCSGY